MPSLDRFACGSLIALALAWPVAAGAQARFTLKELSKPSGAKSCVARGDLNDKGEAATICTWLGGYQRSGVWFGNIPIPTSKAWYVDKAVLWPASGSSKVLAQSNNQRLFGTFWLLNSGSVYADVMPVNNNGSTYDVVQPVVWAAPMGKSSVYLPPVGVSPNVSFARKASGDALILADRVSDQQWVLSAQGAVTRVPEVAPPAKEADFLGDRVSYYDPRSGFRVMTRVRLTGSSNVGNDRYTEHWFHDTASWQRIPAPNGQPIRAIWGMNLQGLVVGVDSQGQPFSWNPGDAASEALPGAWSEQATGLFVNDQGLIAGSVSVAQSSHAAVWWQGQAMDLNTAVTLPRNVVLRQILAVNNRNQLLVLGVDASKQGEAANRLMLLTPQ